jgi:hypothetical protein
MQARGRAGGLAGRQAGSSPLLASMVAHRGRGSTPHCSLHPSITSFVLKGSGQNLQKKARLQ